MTARDRRSARAVITGASSGIGAAFADRLARDGYDLLLVARRVRRLEEHARRFREQYGVDAEGVEADLSLADDLRALERRLARDTGVALLVNNAGFGAFMPFVELDADRAEELIRVQVLAVTRLTRAVLPGMIERGSGAVVNVSSRLAWSARLPSPPMPPRAVYAATKAFVNTFTQILHSELEGTGVRVQALCPGLVRTEFFERMGMDQTMASLPEAMIMTPEAVVEASLRALEMGEVLCVPALEEPEVLAEIDGALRRLFDRSNSGQPAARYSFPE